MIRVEIRVTTDSCGTTLVQVPGVEHPRQPLKDLPRALQTAVECALRAHGIDPEKGRPR